MARPLTAKRLRELLDYDERTGVFTHKQPKLLGRKAGTVKQGGASNGGGYVRIMLDGKRYYAHRLAWLYVYGKFPKKQIDHKKGIRSDNRIAELRTATISQQRANKDSSNSSGFRGVVLCKDRINQSKKWKASIQVKGKTILLGRFASAKEASAAYRQAAEKYHGEFAFNNR